MIRYGIIALVILAFAIGAYVLLAYKFDTIIVYDREAAYTTVGSHLSVQPEFMINANQEVRVFINFEDIHESALLKNLEVSLTPAGDTSKTIPLLSVSVSDCNVGKGASSFLELSETCKLLQPGYQTPAKSFTFAFDANTVRRNAYLVRIRGNINTDGSSAATPFEKEISIEKETVLRERSLLF
jgi:hypothetical protein